MAYVPLEYRMLDVFRSAVSAQVQHAISKDYDLPGQARDAATVLYVDLLEKMHTDLCTMVADGTHREVLYKISGSSLLGDASDWSEYLAEKRASYNGPEALPPSSKYIPPLRKVERKMPHGWWVIPSLLLGSVLWIAFFRSIGVI